ncbi:MAG TPA: vanadium-dependent haloperoxidase [Planctomycetota bacterium]|nr:vanadium-dependent haloperoxidase [Planctomycetota bacterium]
MPHPRRLLVAVVVLVACVAPAPADAATVATTAHAALRELVAHHRLDPLLASRHHALLAVAQERAIAALGHRNASARQQREAVLGASAGMLMALFSPAAAPVARGASPLAIGLAAARDVLAERAGDGHDLAWDGVLPTGPGLWYSSANPPAAPLRPRWSQTDAWFLDSDERFLPPPPPAYGSSEFVAALAEVRAISDTRTPEQLAIAQRWGDGPGTPTPPGHWNAIACALIDEACHDEGEAAAALSLVQRAVMDAGICVWHAKYAYCLARPPQADPAITTPIGLPNFPAYTSGHAGFSGAASEVLAYLFPERAGDLRAMAEEAAASRVIAGIHYRFDGEWGLWQGRQVAEAAIAAAVPVACH